MSKHDPLDLNDLYLYRPNPWAQMVPSVPTFQCETCNWEAPSYSILKEHQFILHDFPQIRPISPILDSPSTPPVNKTSSVKTNNKVHIKPKITSVGQSRINLYDKPNIKTNAIHSVNKNVISEQSTQPTSRVQEPNPKEVWLNKCTNCGACFTRKNNLNRHIAKSCPNDPKSDYSKKKTGGIKCFLCSKLFSNKSNMSQHIKNNH